MNINLTLIGQLLAFVIFVWFTKRYVWSFIIAALDERKAKIAEGLAAAERGQHEQELAEAKAVKRIKEAKDQAAKIINQAHKRASEIIDDARERAKQEGDRQLAASKAELEQETNRVRQELGDKVAQLVVSGAEKILRREVNADSHKDVVDRIAAEL